MTNIHLLNVAPLITVVQCLEGCQFNSHWGLYCVVRSCSLCVCVGCLKCQSVRVWMGFFSHVFECVAPAVTHLHPQHSWDSSKPPPPNPLNRTPLPSPPQVERGGIENRWTAVNAVKDSTSSARNASSQSSVLKFNFTCFHWPAVNCFDPLSFWHTWPVLEYMARTQKAAVWKWNKTPTLSSLSLTLSLPFPSFLPPVLEMGRCEFSASRWAWSACATPTSKRSTNVSATLAGVPNASPQLQTMSQQQQNKPPQKP